MPNRPNLTALGEHLLTEPLFKGIDPAALQQLAESATWHQYAAGEVVFLEGETAPGLYFLESGGLKIVMTSPEDREQVLLYLAPGEIFNPLGAFANRPNPATAIALEAAGVWLLSREAMGRLLRDWLDLAQRVIANMANRLVQLTALVEDLSLRPVSARLARLLLENAQADVLARPRWHTQAELAARLGTVPDMVGRPLRPLAHADHRLYGAGRHGTTGLCYPRVGGRSQCAAFRTGPTCRQETARDRGDS